MRREDRSLSKDRLDKSARMSRISQFRLAGRNNNNFAASLV